MAPAPAVTLARRLGDLPPGAHALIDAAGIGEFCSTRAWYSHYESLVLPGPVPAVWLYAEAGGQPLVVLPLQITATGRLRLRTLASLGNYYTTLMRIPTAADATPEALADAVAACVVRARADLGRFDAVELGPLAQEDPALPAAHAALARLGFRTARLEAFGNWHEAIGDGGWAGYLARRPGQLRSTLKRRGKKLAQDAPHEFRILRAPDEILAAMPDYEAIYSRSWKHGESHPEFLRRVAADLGAAGRTRLGMLYVRGAPAASQLWFLNGRTAGVYKLAYDPEFRDYSVGSLLTAHMIESFIRDDGVEVVDFLMGDDDYKRDWVTQRQPRWTLEAIDPRTARGLLLLAKRRIWSSS